MCIGVRAYRDVALHCHRQSPDLGWCAKPGISHIGHQQSLSMRCIISSTASRSDPWETSRTGYVGHASGRLSQITDKIGQPNRAASRGGIGTARISTCRNSHHVSYEDCCPG